MHIDCSDIYSMGRDFGAGGALTLDPVDPALDALALALGDVTPQEPLRFRVQAVRKAGDIVGTSFAVLDIVSPRVAECLTAHGFTGWSTFPIEVEGRMSDELAGYRGLVITGRSGPFDERLGERVMLPPPVPEGAWLPHRRGCCPEPGTWDGSDLFTPEGTAFTCVTSSVRAALLDAGLVGVTFQAMADLAILITDD